MRRATIIGVTVVGLCLHTAAHGEPADRTEIDPPAGQGALAPNLVPVDDGALLTWLEPADPSDESADAVYRLRFAGFDGDAWGPPATIVEGSDLFVNWADVPSMARAGDGALVAHWLQRSGVDTYAYDVMLARSTDGGGTWKRLGPAHDDGTKTEHGFVSLVPQTDGARAFWLDGREMGGHDAGDMTLRTTLVGETIGAGAVLDPRVCECCSTSAVMTADGPLIAYRDRSPEEVRDIFAVRRVAGAWTSPRRVHDDGWTMAACPVNGPAVDARGRLVAVAWYTGAANRPAVRVAFSRDAGATFNPP
ncbi:MAG: sialidase family protein, partial [Planctomycetota bacterium]